MEFWAYLGVEILTANYKEALCCGETGSTTEVDGSSCDIPSMAEIDREESSNGATGAATFYGGEGEGTTIEGPADTTSTFSAFCLTDGLEGGAKRLKEINADDRIEVRGTPSIGSIKIGLAAKFLTLDEEGGLLETFLEPLRPEQVRTMRTVEQN